MVQLLDCNTPTDIENTSFAIIDSEVPEPRPFSPDAWSVARRLIHTTGDISLVPSLSLPDEAVMAGVQAIQNGASIFTDTEMAKSGISTRRLNPFGCQAECLLAQEGVAEKAAKDGCTRSRAGMELLAPRLAGSIVGIGNAPTALLALLDLVAAGQVPPALVIGMPVGFVNAAESKELLLAAGIPCLVLRGRRGGSPLIAAAVNALAELALQQKTGIA